MTDIFRDSVWPGLIIWVALYISDYAFTIVCARMYRAQDKVVFEGSYEITPAFQDDINALRIVSPRFLLALCVSVGLLWLLWQQTVQASGWPEAYFFILGTMITLELIVHVRHLRNWFLFSQCFGEDGVRGRIEYPRGILLRVSAFELLVFAGFLSMLFLVTRSWFILGGATSCATTAWSHYRLANKHVSTTKASD